jgi:ribonuclease D
VNWRSTPSPPCQPGFRTGAGVGFECARGVGDTRWRTRAEKRVGARLGRREGEHRQHARLGEDGRGDHFELRDPLAPTGREAEFSRAGQLAGQGGVAAGRVRRERLEGLGTRIDVIRCEGQIEPAHRRGVDGQRGADLQCRAQHAGSLCLIEHKDCPGPDGGQEDRLAEGFGLGFERGTRQGDERLAAQCAKQNNRHDELTFGAPRGLSFRLSRPLARIGCVGPGRSPLPPARINPRNQIPLPGGPTFVADFERIEHPRDLEALARELRGESTIAVDTEADSFYHYFDKTCLVQVSTPRSIYLVDPIALGGPEALAPLGPILASRSIRKIFHAAEYDLYVLKRDCGFRFANLFDTMISAQLLGYPSIGLSALAERHFGVRLPKDEQRSDWSTRPLRDSQLTYAAADVAHLIPLAERLEAELVAAERLAWAQKEFEALARREWPERAFDRLGYLRIKGARSLDPTTLSILRELYLVRDRRAREIDRPPFKVLGNRALLEIAEAKPESEEALAQIKGVSELVLRRFGREILAAVERGTRKKHGPIPKRLNGAGGPRRRMDRSTERRLGVLKRWRSARARELALDPGVLCPNSALEAIAFANPRTLAALRELPEVKGWFAESFGGELLESLASATDGEA